MSLFIFKKKAKRGRPKKSQTASDESAASKRVSRRKTSRSPDVKPKHTGKNASKSSVKSSKGNEENTPRTKRHHSHSPPRATKRKASPSPTSSLSGRPARRNTLNQRLQQRRASEESPTIPLKASKRGTAEKRKRGISKDSTDSKDSATKEPLVKKAKVHPNVIEREPRSTHRRKNPSAPKVSKVKEEVKEIEVNGESSDDTVDLNESEHVSVIKRNKSPEAYQKYYKLTDWAKHAEVQQKEWEEAMSRDKTEVKQEIKEEPIEANEKAEPEVSAVVPQKDVQPKSEVSTGVPQENVPRESEVSTVLPRENVPTESEASTVIPQENVPPESEASTVLTSENVPPKSEVSTEVCQENVPKVDAFDSRKTAVVRAEENKPEIVKVEPSTESNQDLTEKDCEVSNKEAESTDLPNISELPANNNLKESQSTAELVEKGNQPESEMDSDSRAVELASPEESNAEHCAAQVNSPRKIVERPVRGSSPVKKASSPRSALFSGHVKTGGRDWSNVKTYGRRNKGKQLCSIKRSRSDEDEYPRERRKRKKDEKQKCKEPSKNVATNDTVASSESSNVSSEKHKDSKHKPEETDLLSPKTPDTSMPRTSPCAVSIERLKIVEETVVASTSSKNADSRTSKESDKSQASELIGQVSVVGDNHYTTLRESTGTGKQTKSDDTIASASKLEKKTDSGMLEENGKTSPSKELMLVESLQQ